MTPAAQGRFCDSCQKTVIDFTTMTDAEIKAAMPLTGGCCGRFTQRQLARSPEQRASWRNAWPLAALLVLAAPAASLARPPLVQLQLAAADTTILRGQVVDEAGHGIAHVTVGIAGANIRTSTDTSGYYALPLAAAPAKHWTLWYEASGYLTERRAVKHGKVPLKVVLKESVLVGAVSVVQHLGD